MASSSRPTAALTALRIFTSRMVLDFKLIPANTRLVVRYFSDIDDTRCPTAWEGSITSMLIIPMSSAWSSVSLSGTLVR